MGGRYFLWLCRTRTHLNAAVLWTAAATSSKTGGFLNFIESYIVRIKNPLNRRKLFLEALDKSCIIMYIK